MNDHVNIKYFLLLETPQPSGLLSRGVLYNTSLLKRIPPSLGNPINQRSSSTAEDSLPLEF